MSADITFAEAARRFKHYVERSLPIPGNQRKPYPRAIRGIYRVLFRVADNARRDIAQHGIGKAIWGRGANDEGSNLPKFVFPTRLLARSGALMEVGVFAKGIPAMMETGAKTKAHAILPRASKLVATRKASLAALGRNRSRIGKKAIVGGGVLKMADGRFVRYAEKQSAMIPKRGSIDRLVREAEDSFAIAVDRALQDDAKEMLDGAA